MSGTSDQRRLAARGEEALCHVASVRGAVHTSLRLLAGGTAARTPQELHRELANTFTAAGRSLAFLQKEGTAKMGAAAAEGEAELSAEARWRRAVQSRSVTVLTEAEDALPAKFPALRTTDRRRCSSLPAPRRFRNPKRSRPSSSASFTALSETVETQPFTQAEVEVLLERLPPPLQSAFVHAFEGGPACRLDLVYTGLFRAAILFRPSASPSSPALGAQLGLEATHVALYGVDEPLPQAPGSGLGMSKHDVFRRISEHAQEALAHFVLQTPKRTPDLLIRWLLSYHNLFNVSCVGCGKVVAMEEETMAFLPPTFRDYSTLEAFHPACLPLE